MSDFINKPIRNYQLEAIQALHKEVQMLRTDTDWQAAAALAGGMIAASGRPHSAQEAIDLMNAVYYEGFTKADSVEYMRWQGAEQYDRNKPHT